MQQTELALLLDPEDTYLMINKNLLCNESEPLTLRTMPANYFDGQKQIIFLLFSKIDIYFQPQFVDDWNCHTEIISDN